MNFDIVTEKALDLMREQTLGTGLTLDILKHDPTRGYSLIASIDRGWNIGESAQPGSDLTCQIVESTVVTATQLGDVRAFGFNNSVYQIVENGIAKPLGTWRRLWTFLLSKTAEAY